MEKISDYEAPSIKDHGDLAELTAGKKLGTKFDGTFPEGTDIPGGFATTP